MKRLASIAMGTNTMSTNITGMSMDTGNTTTITKRAA